ncbi:HTH-type transcriptional regulator MtrR [Burkholderia pseudomultivorans]|nr:HTH-type transcriptional regulator MtrR [Burkholderia pseudomultivorans]
MKKRLDPAPRAVPAPPEPAVRAGAPAAAEPLPPAAAGVRRKKAPEQVRAQLLAAASDIATQQGVAALTLDAVAERAGVTKGALQYHFANKQGLLDALFGQATERFATQMAAPRIRTATARRRARMCMRCSIPRIRPPAPTCCACWSHR